MTTQQQYLGMLQAGIDTAAWKARTHESTDRFTAAQESALFEEIGDADLDTLNQAIVYGRTYYPSGINVAVSSISMEVRRRLAQRPSPHHTQEADWFKQAVLREHSSGRRASLIASGCNRDTEDIERLIQEATR